MESQRESIPASPSREDSPSDRPLRALSCALRSAIRGLPLPERVESGNDRAGASWIESRAVRETTIALLIDSGGIIVEGRLSRPPADEPLRDDSQCDDSQRDDSQRDDQLRADHELFFTTLLAWLRGTSLQEAAEHGVGAFRHRLDVPESEPPLAGIRHARYPHSYFDRAETLLRDIWSQRRNELGGPPEHNSSECGLRGPFRWAAATAPTRRGWTRAALDEALAEEGIPLDRLRIERVDHDWIVYLHLEPGLRVDVAGRVITRAEASLRRRHDPRVELFLPSWEDRNLLRRRTRQVALDGSR